MQKEFAKVIADNQARIKYITSRYCQSNDYDDLYQEILMQLWRSFASFKGQSSRETWLYKVALNTASTFISKTIKHRELEQALTEVVSTEGGYGEEHSQAEILNTFMNTLTDIESSILMMYLDGFSSEQISDVIGITANAVRVRVKRIKSSFENQFIGDES